MSVEAFAELIALLPDATVLVSGAGLVLAGNAAAQAVLGAGIAGRPLADLVSSPAAEVEALLRASARTRDAVPGALAVARAGGAVHFRASGAVLRPRRDGADAIVLLRLQPRDAAAAQFLALNERIDALHREIERRRRVENELRAQREWLEVTLTSIGDAVISTDPDGRVTFLNPRAEVLTGWSSAEASGRPIDEVFRIANEETGEPVDNPVSKVIASGLIVGLANHTVLLSRDGRAVAIEDSAAPIREPGGATRGVVLVFHDVAEQRALQREVEHRAASLAEADRRKDEFIAMLAHELRNPLAALRGGLHVLARAPEPATLARIAAVMERQVGNLTRMVDDLLEVSRITRGKVALQRDAVDVVELARRAVADHASRAGDAGLTLRADLPDEPAWVIADATRITQILDNLLTNAVKFSDRGGAIEVRVAASPAGEVELVVRDEGVGIDPEILPHVFESFVQADRTLDRSRGGLGLGLTLVKGLVDLHGGTITAASPGIGRGCEMVLRLPRAPAPAPAAAAPEPSPATADPLRVLLIDDNLDVVETLAMILESAGCSVHVAHDGPAGLAAVAGFRPQAVVCDIGLPGMDGFAVAGALRALPGCAGVRLLALTGYGEPAMRARVTEAGFDEHLVKPVAPTVLLRALRPPEGAVAEATSHPWRGR
ncbi:MAG: ATP-binding protein [Deltaproteobacteria bacterium]|nr:ATP-binding protein [Myxococcales bacterium]MDP3213052.1 ATP-binding protein [Deltaproteobacteria bacterium]